jgi:hypothetical protein
LPLGPTRTDSDSLIKKKEPEEEKCAKRNMALHAAKNTITYLYE